MDLSAMIFIALALAWAVYLIPKALQQHDEMARSRSVEKFSSRMRVFGGAAPSSAAPAEPAVAEPEATVAPVARPLVTRAAARSAAARRRKVLYALTTVLAAVVGAAVLSYLPRWAIAVPVALIVAFLVTARLTVRREQSRVPRGEASPVPTPVTTAAPVEADAEVLDREDTVGLNRAELDEPAALPLADEGSLWDPLPVTLPTYVSKPQVRRTVRTIELTQTQSSGHDAADSELVRQAEAAQAAEVVEAATESEQRRAAGA